MFNLKDTANGIKNEAPPSEVGETRPLPEAKTPTLIKMMVMMVWEGALFVLVKVRDCIIKEKHLILSSAPKDK